MIDDDYLIKMSEVMNNYDYKINHIFCEDETIPIIIDECDCKG